MINCLMKMLDLGKVIAVQGCLHMMKAPDMDKYSVGRTDPATGWMKLELMDAEEARRVLELCDKLNRIEIKDPEGNER